MAEFTLFASIAVKPGKMAAFLPIIMENATASVRDEPGCSVFDVIMPKDSTGDTLYLYEVYDDAAAFAAHQTMPHYHKFTSLKDDYVDGLTPYFGERVSP